MTELWSSGDMAANHSGMVQDSSSRWPAVWNIPVQQSGCAWKFKRSEVHAGISAGDAKCSRKSAANPTTKHGGRL